MTTGSHPQQTESEGIHQPFNWIWADSTERLAETVTALDINKVGFQQSDNSMWVLTAITPTWFQIGGSQLAVPGDGADSVMLLGTALTADGVGAAALGGDGNNAIGDYSGSIAGRDSEAVADFSLVNGDSVYTERFGEFARGGGVFNDPGDAQYGDLPMRAEVTHSDANWYQLFLDGVSELITIPEDAVLTFDALITGATQALAKVFSFRIVGCIKNTAGTTALSGTPTVTTISDGDDVSFDARAVANDTDDSLDIEVQDIDGAGDTVQWTAVVRINQNVFPA